VIPGSVIGVDLSDRMLAIARSKPSKNTQFVGMAAERLVFRPETFDLVTMGEALAYLSDPTDALAEANRVLRPGGRLAVSAQRRSLSTRAQASSVAPVVLTSSISTTTDPMSAVASLVAANA